MGTRQQTISEWETGMYKPRGASATLQTTIAERANSVYRASEGAESSRDVVLNRRRGAKPSKSNPGAWKPAFSALQGGIIEKVEGRLLARIWEMQLVAADNMVAGSGERLQVIYPGRGTGIAVPIFWALSSPPIAADCRSAMWRFTEGQATGGATGISMTSGITGSYSTWSGRGRHRWRCKTAEWCPR